jgi:PfaD family protein
MPRTGADALSTALARVDRPLFVVDTPHGPGVSHDGSALIGAADGDPPADAWPLTAHVPAIMPEALGDPEFRATHGLRFAHVAGAMANGIGSTAIVEAMARAGMLGFFGSAGLPLDRVEQAIDRLQSTVGDLPHGFNLIHSPSEPDLEAAVADLYLRRGVCLISASAYLRLTLPIVRYRVAGIHRDAAGRVVTPNRIVAKVSRVEVARRFFSPPPEALLNSLVAEGFITADQAAMAATIPMAEDLTAEADSGGHTDNRPLVALLPTMLALRDELAAEFRYDRPLRVGAAGGIATPSSAAAAFAMGAAYVLTGSINQACVEAGTSAAVRDMLAKAGQADVIMAPAADMFEMGVQVQVLKWGTLFAVRGRKLYEAYRAYESLEAIPAEQRAVIEKDLLRCTLEEAWTSTRDFFTRRDPRQIARAERDPKHKMALVFRSYLGQASRWAIGGDASRKADYQVWCGPAMGAFNEWVRGSFLEPAENRDVATVARNLMLGAAVVTRGGWLKAQGVALPPGQPRFDPLPPEALAVYFENADDTSTSLNAAARSSIDSRQSADPSHHVQLVRGA